MTSYERDIPNTTIPPLPGYTSIPTCCTCASVLLSEADKQPTIPTDRLENRQTGCCHRFICGKCIDKNPRFLTYCPFCQTAPNLTSCFSALPPSYSPVASTTTFTITRSPLPRQPSSSSTTPPPSYESAISSASPSSSREGVIHYIHPHDTLASLSLLYNTPAPLLRAANNIFSDHLLPARRTLFIPYTAFYSGPSLSPSSPDDSATEIRKLKIKRFQLRSKCVEYKLAEWYLIESEWDEEEAIMRWRMDEEWEKRHPNPLGLKEGKRGCGRTTRRGSIVEEAEKRVERAERRARRWGLPFAWV